MVDNFLDLLYEGPLWLFFKPSQSAPCFVLWTAFLNKPRFPILKWSYLDLSFVHGIIVKTPLYIPDSLALRITMFLAKLDARFIQSSTKIRRAHITHLYIKRHIRKLTQPAAVDIFLDAQEVWSYLPPRLFRRVKRESHTFRKHLIHINVAFKKLN